MSLHHVFAGERLTAFSDAVFAIVATIMVIPLKIESSNVDPDFLLDDYLRNGDFFSKFGIYWFSFLIVLDSWYAHNRIFKLVDLVDDVITWLNLIVLLLVSFMPAAIVLVGAFQKDPIVISISCGNLILINLVMMVLLFSAFRQKTLLHPQLTTNVNSNSHMRFLKFTMFIPHLINIILAIVAVIFTWTLEGSPQVSQLFFFSIGTAPLISRFIIWRIYKWRKRTNAPSEIQEALLKAGISKERSLAFSDGVFSIVATLLVLDITTIEIPEEAQSSHGNITEFIHNNRYEFVTYIASFFVVGLLWFVHHSMFQYFKYLSSWLTMSNAVSLMFVGLIPFGAGTVSEFTEGNNAENEVTAIRTFSLVIIFASLSQLFVWSVAHCQKSKCFYPAVDHPAVESIQMIKLLIFPILGLIFYGFSFWEGLILHHFFSLFIIAAPVLFIIPRLIIRLVSYCRERNGTVQSPSYSVQYSIISKDIDETDDILVLRTTENNENLPLVRAPKRPAGVITDETHLRSSNVEPMVV